MTVKKKINLEEVKMEQLKKVLTNIDKVSDLYQNTQLRIMLIQALGGIYTTTSSREDLPTGREALDSTSLKENNIVEEAVEEIKEAVSEVVEEAKAEVKETVSNIKDAIAEVMEQEYPEEIADPEVAPMDVTGIEQVMDEAEVPVETVEEVTEEAPQQVGTILEEDLFIDAGDGTQVNIKEAFNRLAALPDDESKQYIAFYLSYYDAESVAAIVSAFSSEITSDAFELLNADNYMAFLEYFNACLQG